MVNLSEMSRIIKSADKVLEAIDRAEELATRTTRHIDGIPRAGRRSSLVEIGAVKAADLEEAYEETVQKVQAMRSELAVMIESLPNIDDRAIMRLRYIKGYTPERIAEGVFRSERSVFYRIQKAKEQLAEKYPDRFIAD